MLSGEEFVWHEFKYVYMAHKVPFGLHMEIVDWLRSNDYGPKSFSGQYDTLYIFATNYKDIATHFKLVWVTKISKESTDLPEDSYTYNLMGKN